MKSSAGSMAGLSAPSNISTQYARSLVQCRIGGGLLDDPYLLPGKAVKVVKGTRATCITGIPVSCRIVSPGPVESRPGDVK